MLTARYWRERPQRFRLEANKCSKCSTVHFPPRRVCKKCGHRSFQDYVLPDGGTLHSFTVIRVPTSDFVDAAPYAVGILELTDGTRLTAQVVDVPFEKLAIGMHLRLEFRKLISEGEAGIHCYGYKAVPA